MTTPESLTALADRVEREEPSDELDAIIARVVLGANRYVLSYTTSLDSAVRPEGDGVFWRSGHDGNGPDPSMFKAEVLIVRNDWSGSFFGIARTEAAARRASELRALAALRARAADMQACCAPHLSPEQKGFEQ